MENLGLVFQGTVALVAVLSLFLAMLKWFLNSFEKRMDRLERWMDDLIIAELTKNKELNRSVF